MKLLEFFSDPGHGWLKVPKSLLKELAIDKKISGFSYQKGEFAYLEEDCDASLFMDKIKFTNLTIRIIEHNSPNDQSLIRTYENYEAQN